MNNFLMLLIATGSWPLCACSSPPQERGGTTDHGSRIVVEATKGEPADFVLCKDGRVIVFPVAHPETCS